MKIQHKVLVVPYLKYKECEYYIIVKGRRYQDWTFVSGSVDEQDGSSQRAVERELFEETKGAINIKLHEWEHKIFNTMHIENDYIMLYNVYFVDLTGYKLPHDIVHEFNHSMLRGKIYQENTRMLIASLDYIQKTPLWSFTKKIISEYVMIDSVN